MNYIITGKTFKQIIKKPIFGLYRQLNGRNILVSMYRKLRENSRPRDLRLFTSTKGVVSVIKTSCAYSVTLKRINKTPHSFLHFHIVIWTRKLLWKYMSCLSKLLLHELWPKQLRERFIIVAKLYIFLLKKQDNYLRRSYISIQLVIQCYTICRLDVSCPHIFNGSSTSETTNFVSY